MLTLGKISTNVVFFLQIKTKTRTKYCFIEKASQNTALTLTIIFVIFYIFGTVGWHCKFYVTIGTVSI